MIQQALHKLLPLDGVLHVLLSLRIANAFRNVFFGECFAGLKSVVIT